MSPSIAANLAGGPDLLSPASPAAPTTPEASLFLEVQVNQVPVADLVNLMVVDGSVWADRQALGELGLRLDAIPSTLWQGDRLRLDSLPDVQMGYDPLRQRLRLMVPVQLLERTTLHSPLKAKAANPPADASPAGFVLNYDFNLQHIDRRTQRLTDLTAWSEWRFFHTWGVFSQTLYSRLAERGVDSAMPRHQRLDTVWRTDFPERSLSLVLGDTVTSGPSWSRAVRIGGLRIGTDFGLQPYRSTRPLTTFQGHALLPSTVDLFVNGMLQEHLQVLPGRFTVESLPSINGAGIAQMVVTDITGQRTALEVPLYGTAELLQRGLTEWSIETGAVRTIDMLGRSSYASDLVTNGFWRHGWSEALTLESHAIRSDGLRLVGLGAVTRLGARGGLVNASVVSSEGANGTTGRQITAGFQWSSYPWRFSLRSQRATDQFQDLSATTSLSSISRSDRVFFGFGEARWDTGLAALRQQDQRGRQVSLLSLSTGWQTAGGWRWTLSWSTTRSSNTERRVGLALTVPLGRELSLSVSAQRQRDGSALGWDFRRSSMNGDEWSWRIGQSASGGSTQMGANVDTSLGRWNGSIDRIASSGGSNTSNSVRTAFGGGLAIMAGRAFLTGPIDDAFALVSTNGLPDLPVKLENRSVGQTDAQGYLLVNRLSALQRNQLSVDVLDLPYEVATTATSLEAVPQRLRGAKVHFDFRRVVSVRATVLDTTKRALPAGSSVTLDKLPDHTPPADAQRMVLFPQIGHNGGLFIENPVTDAVITITRSPGRACRIQLPPREQDSILQVDLGELTCQ